MIINFRIAFVHYLVLLVSITVFASCNEVKETKQGNTIFYYPKANVYYDVEEKQYFFYSNNNEWKTEKNEGTFQKDSLGRNVVIDKPSLPVWKDNEHHRLVYGAALYTSAVDLQRKYYEDSINSLPKPPPVAIKKDTALTNEEGVEAEAEKDKKGLKKFLDKVFKKKN